MTYFIARSNVIPQTFELKELNMFIFSVAVVLFDTTMKSNSTPMKFSGLGLLPFATWPNGHMSIVCQHFQKAYPLKIPDKFHFNSIGLWGGAENLYIWSRSHVMFLSRTTGLMLETSYVAFGS